MRIYCAIITLVSSLFLINGNEAFARERFAPLACSGYNNNSGETCVATCEEGEIAICQNASDEDTPKCSCEAGGSDRSLNDFLRKLKEQTVKARGNEFSFLQDIILQGDRNIFPKGETVLPAAAQCLPYDPENPLVMYCDTNLIDVFYVVPEVTP